MTTTGSFKKWSRAAAGLAVSALLLAACGEGGAETENDLTRGPENSSHDADGVGDGEGDEAGSDAAAAAPTPGTVETDSGDVTVTARGVKFGVVDAPRQLQIISDARCPYCAQFSEALASDELEWGQGDQIAVEHVMVTVLDDGSRDTFSARAANILAVVADQDPANWRAASDEIYRIQPEQSAPDPTNEEITNALAEVGVNVDEAFLAAVEQMKFDAWNEENTEWARSEVKIPHVPFALIDGEPLEGGDTIEDMVTQIKEALG